MAVVRIGAGTKKDNSPTKVDELPISFFDYFEWTKDAVCVRFQLSMFFTASSSQMAKTICHHCPVKSQCLTWALMYKEEGIWGGTTFEERRRLLPYYNIEALKSRAVHFGVYYPKRSAKEVRESLSKAG